MTAEQNGHRRQNHCLSAASDWVGLVHHAERAFGDRRTDLVDVAYAGLWRFEPTPVDPVFEQIWEAHVQQAQEELDERIRLRAKYLGEISFG